MRTRTLALPSSEDPPNMQIVAPDRIKQLRVDNRRSLRWLAKRVGCSHTQIAKYENGVTREIREDWAVTIALLLDFPFASVFQALPEIRVSKVSTGLDNNRQLAS
jgi:transcriptional regulator with XRE-family HTH domain